MALTAEELLSAVADLTSQDDLRIPIEPSVKGGLFISLSTLIGAVVCRNRGPSSILLGSTIGTSIGRAISAQYIPVAILLHHHIGLDQQAILIGQVYRLVKDLKFKSKDDMMSFLAKEDAVHLKSLIRSVVKNFIRQGLRLEIR